ncbi:cobalt-precorrin-5B (C(1))-methyltransferase [Methanoregula sp.]|uniref:cobalt-precorrin-5B (C(1))-methyltransferase n=1 Tax=Methanoregula sp. TaxID=2052170 RepID=UPI000CC9CC6E|nr:cobalt-precorrin-5B (C(1))-methyltransferase [Methanoregula sp.]PKG31978.1 MAG: cobalt-precorrin-5B (C(1))-methyltransferase [Methanoregula sp.]
MRDPVTGFEYPDAWVEKCQRPGQLPLVERGLAILTSSGTILARGFTTGTTAAAACKAAVLSRAGRQFTSVPIALPCGLTVNVPAEGSAGQGTARKVPGDYPGDVTAGLLFVAEATPTNKGIVISFGEGVGRFARDTPRYKAGTPAVSPPALACIHVAVEEAIKEAGFFGIEVRLTIPQGKEIGRITLNPRVGVMDGISVLGTTGLVEPWDDHLTESTLERIAATDEPVLTTDRVGLRFARLMFPTHEVILIGGKLDRSVAAVRGKAILFGLPALILKYINPQVLEGTGSATVEELSVTPAFPAIVEKNLAAFRKRYPQIRVVLVNREGEVIGESA